jgi:hypothetical protein
MDAHGFFLLTQKVDRNTGWPQITGIGTDEYSNNEI